ncbi:MAG: RNA polymerase sporulation sigma factor SigG [Christensenellales bacterium]|jgi:RNA polymerase sporulation-specific sigma factor
MSNKVSICGVNTNKLPKLKNDELTELMKKVKNGDEFAREEFVVANLRLVLSVVHRFGGRREKADDMFQVGCVGLMKAIDNFNVDLGVRFSTYAVPMIIGEIRRFLRDNNSIRVSRSLRDTAYQSLQAKERLTSQLDREPTIEEIANEIGLSDFSVSNSLDAISDTISLNQPVYKDGNETVRIMDQISDTKNHDDLVEEISLKDAIVKLTGREKEILTLRYFIGKTQMEVSNEVGISQAQVSRLEKNALKTIKKLIN